MICPFICFSDLSHSIGMAILIIGFKVEKKIDSQSRSKCQTLSCNPGFHYQISNSVPQKPVPNGQSHQPALPPSVFSGIFLHPFWGCGWFWLFSNPVDYRNSLFKLVSRGKRIILLVFFLKIAYHYANIFKNILRKRYVQSFGFYI